MTSWAEERAIRSILFCEEEAVLDKPNLNEIKADRGCSPWCVHSEVWAWTLKGMKRYLSLVDTRLNGNELAIKNWLEIWNQTVACADWVSRYGTAFPGAGEALEIKLQLKSRCLCCHSQEEPTVLLLCCVKQSRKGRTRRMRILFFLVVCLSRGGERFLEKRKQVYWEMLFMIKIALRAATYASLLTTLWRQPMGIVLSWKIKAQFDSL